VVWFSRLGIKALMMTIATCSVLLVVSSYDGPYTQEEEEDDDETTDHNTRHGRPSVAQGSSMKMLHGAPARWTWTGDVKCGIEGWREAAHRMEFLE
jgi:hypothetical protein